jgi:hypothetical protein
MGKTTFSGPMHVVNGVVAAVTVPTYTTGTAPAVASVGTTIYVSDGRSGLPTLAVSDGSNWISSDGYAISTS